jgi:dipeptidyl aminopeptidase/acylaminoacyl peptidase
VGRSILAGKGYHDRPITPDSKPMLRSQEHYLLPLRTALAILGLSILASCSDAAGPEDPLDEGVDLSLLFAAPTPGEVNAILGEWAGRDVSAADVVDLDQAVLPYGSQGVQVRVVSHRVGDVTHVGAIAAPVGAVPESLPILVYSHGGDQGVNLDFTLLALPFLLDEAVDGFVFVIPSFRSETLVFDGVPYESGGEPGPWDRDVDDALALVEVALATTPEADPGRIGVLGFSRGADVAMLMAIRDPRIDAVVEFFGPTDFFGPFVREVVEDALDGSVRDLPGVSFLDEEFIQPLSRGEVSIAEMRLELLRRSPVYFADRLPDLQVHHGTEDDVVPVGEAERLIEVMEGLGRTQPEFEAYIYEGGGHDPLSLPGSLPRTQAFLERLVAGS